MFWFGFCDFLVVSGFDAWWWIVGGYGFDVLVGFGL